MYSLSVIFSIYDNTYTLIVYRKYIHRSCVSVIYFVSKDNILIYLNVQPLSLISLSNVRVQHFGHYSTKVKKQMR